MNVKRILVADDEIDVRMLLSGFIQMAGWTAEEACSGRDVLRLTAEKKFDAVLLDWQFGGSNAIQVLSRLRQRRSAEDVKCILLCSDASEIDKEEFLQLGFAGILEKSFSMQDTIKSISEILGWKK